MTVQINNGEIFIGLDCEWVVLRGSAFSALTRQVTVPKGVELVQISLLLNQKIVKVGKNIGGDIKRLDKTFEIKENPSDLCGEVELGGYCRDKDVVEQRMVGLADLCGKILKRRLPKPNIIRCGDWEREEFTDEQKNYAALDAWVSLKIFLRVQGLPLVRQKVNDTTPPLTFVALYSKIQQIYDTPGDSVGNATIGNENSSNTSTKLPSRVLKDPFYLMDMLKISLRHGMAKEFMRRFRDCLFVVGLEDKIKVEEYLHSKGSPSLYTEKDVDRNGLMRNHCSRGTNSVKGSVHMSIVRKFVTYSAGPRLADMVLTDYRLCHSLDVGSKNRHGKIYKSHFSPWISQSINMLRIELGYKPIDNYYTNCLGSTFDYQHTNETFGIVELPHSIIGSYDTIINSNQAIPDLVLTNTPQKLLQLSVLPASQLPVIGYSNHNFITSIAVTAIHTPEEILLFKKLIVERHELFSPDNENANSSVNAKKKEEGKKEHLQRYYNILEDGKKYDESVSMNMEVS
ncbi:hypothetical protein K501DRAFT_272009 [Backusella circina FSU 941]|nr:hypothetical protein K501DRAFT_272009 [Backusella circina FSU 941]